jgi:hypothetical protein
MPEVDGSRCGVSYKVSGDLLLITECYVSPSVEHKRGVVSGFSNGCGMRMVRYLRECTSDYQTFITLTYGADYPMDGRVCKEHLRVFLQRLKRYCKSDIYSAFWFMEFQERGAAHFHIFCTHYIHYKDLALMWFECCDGLCGLGSGTSVERIKRGRGGMMSYARKYAAKQEQKVVPDGFLNVGRFWGVSGVKSRVAAAIFINKDTAEKSEFKVSIADLYRCLSDNIDCGGAVRLPTFYSDEYTVRMYRLKDFDVSRMLMFHVEQLRRCQNELSESCSSATSI